MGAAHAPRSGAFGDAPERDWFRDGVKLLPGDPEIAVHARMCSFGYHGRLHNRCLLGNVET